MLNQSLRIRIVIVALIDTFGCINIKPSVNGQTSLCLENNVQVLVCAPCNDLLVRQQFYVSGDLPSWKSTRRGAFISGPVSTACPQNDKAFLNYDATFSNSSFIVNFNFNLKNVPSNNNVTQSEWTIQQSNGKGLCLTHNSQTGKTWYSVSFDACADGDQNQLWKLNDFYAAEGSSCQSGSKI